jgi:hypothetical protein
MAQPQPTTALPAPPRGQKQIHYAPKSIIFREGEAVDSIVLIERGICIGSCRAVDV